MSTLTAHVPAPPRTERRTLVLAVMCLAVVMVVAGVSMLATRPHRARGRPRGQPVAPAVDRRRLRADPRRAAPARRRARRPLRPAGRAARRASRSSAAPPLVGASPTRRASSSRCRALMGIGAALIMPGTLSTITSVFPPEERAKAVGIWAGFAGAGGTLGILALGRAARGLLLGLDLLRRPPAIAASCSSASCSWSPSTRADRARRASTRSARCCRPLGIGALVLGIIEGPERGWTDPLTLVALVGGVVLLDGVRRSSSCGCREPLLDPRLFRYRGFATGSASLFLQFFAMFGFFFVSLQFLQLVLGYSALDGRARAHADGRADDPDLGGRRHAVGALRAQAGRRRRPRHLRARVPRLRHARPEQRLPAVPRGLDRHRRRCAAGDDAGDERDRRLAPAREAGRGVGGQRHRPRDRRRLRRRRARAARSTSATATTSTSTSAACRRASPTRPGRRRRSRCSSRADLDNGRRSPASPATPSRPACATRCSWVPRSS